SRRRQLLSFVVVGGGFAGTELVAELFDLVHGVLPFYPGIHPDDPRFVLVHSGTGILPELPAELGDYALAKLRNRGIQFRLGTRVAAARESVVQLNDETEIGAGTLVWTAGNRPVPLAGLDPVLEADAALRVRGERGIWAVGDCVRIPDPDNPGKYHPATAQHALREGKAVANNIVAEISGARPEPFRFRTLGILVALGHRTAVADLRGRRFYGLAAWLLWRGIYLGKLPGTEKKLRVLGDWLLDLAFRRDIVHTGPALTTPADSVPDSSATARIPAGEGRR
ncbi:MAG: FAD-dependent oxidoreductase, partial [Kutzneria sp.]|nr:FAD-dependent oxidoreductase [Kutzneria sp.]